MNSIVLTTADTVSAWPGRKSSTRACSAVHKPIIPKPKTKAPGSTSTAVGASAIDVTAPATSGGNGRAAGSADPPRLLESAERRTNDGQHRRIAVASVLEMPIGALQMSDQER